MYAQQQSLFCYININNQIEMIIIAIMICLSVLIVGDAIRKFVKMRGSHNADVTKVYSLILAWWITYVCHHVFNIIQYWIHSNIQSQTMSLFSSYDYIMDWINAFIIQWLLLYVPYHWSKQIIYLFTQIENNIERQSQLTNTMSKYKGPEGKIFKILKYYMIIRVLFLSSCIAFMIYKSNILFIIMLSLLLFDCIIINISLFLGMYSLKFNQKLIEQLDFQQITKMFNQYLMILIANNFRFVLDAYLVFKSTMTHRYFVDRCAVTEEIDKGEIILNVLLCLFAHYMPIIMILRIYHLEDKPEEMGRSLLITTSENNVQE